MNSHIFYEINFCLGNYINFLGYLAKMVYIVSFLNRNRILLSFLSSNEEAPTERYFPLFSITSAKWKQLKRWRVQKDFEGKEMGQFRHFYLLIYLFLVRPRLDEGWVIVVWAHIQAGAYSSFNRQTWLSGRDWVKILQLIFNWGVMLYIVFVLK